MQRTAVLSAILSICLIPGVALADSEARLTGTEVSEAPKVVQREAADIIGAYGPGTALALSTITFLSADDAIATNAFETTRSAKGAAAVAVGSTVVWGGAGGYWIGKSDLHPLARHGLVLGGGAIGVGMSASLTADALKASEALRTGQKTYVLSGRAAAAPWVAGGLTASAWLGGYYFGRENHLSTANDLGSRVERINLGARQTCSN